MTTLLRANASFVGRVLAGTEVPLDQPRDYILKTDEEIDDLRFNSGDWPWGFWQECYPMMENLGILPVSRTEKRVMVPYRWMHYTHLINTHPDGTPFNRQDPDKWDWVGYFLYNRRGNKDVKRVYVGNNNQRPGAMEPAICRMNVVRVVALVHGRYARLQTMSIWDTPPNPQLVNSYTHPHLVHRISYVCRNGKVGWGSDVYPFLWNPTWSGPYVPMSHLKPATVVVQPTKPGDSGHDPTMQSVINAFEEWLPREVHGSLYWAKLVQAVGEDFAHNVMVADRQALYFASGGIYLYQMNLPQEERDALQPYLARA